MHTLSSANIGYMVRRVGTLTCAFTLLVQVVACDEPEAKTRIVVSVDSDLEAPDQLTLLRLTVERTNAAGHPVVSVLEHALTGEQATELPFVATITRLRGDGGEVTVTAEARKGDALVQRRRARAAYLPGKVLSLPVHLSARCTTRYEVCEAMGQTCGDDGRCEDVMRGELGPWRGEPETLDVGPPLDGGIEPVQDATDGAERDARAGESPRVVALALGERHSCMVDVGGRLACWGGNQLGQLGVAEECPDVSSPSRSCRTPRIVSVTNVSTAAAGRGFTCALDREGHALCFGDDERGQRGDGSPEPAPMDGGTLDAGARDAGPLDAGPAAPEVSLGELTNLAALLGGGAFACAVPSTGQALCWGDNGAHQVSSAETLVYTGPVANPRVTAESSLGDAFGCTRTAGGAVRCFGDDQLGQGGFDGVRSGDDEQAIARGASLVRAGAEHACALTDAGTLCWGRGDLGQLGRGPDELTDSCSDRGFDVPCARAPLAVEGGLRFTALALGGLFSCGISSESRVYCWGGNHDGVVDAQSSAIAFARPTRVPGLPEVRLLSAGDKHACAVGIDEQLYCWGSSEFGQLGPGASATDVSAPVLVPLDF